MKNSLRMLIPVVMLTSLLVVSLGFLEIRFEQMLENNLENKLVRITRLTSVIFGHEIEENSAFDIDRFVDDFGSSLNLRITIINGDGYVVADSELNNSAIMQLGNHNERSEIHQARLESYGKSTRLSESLGIEFLYLAMPLSAINANGEFDEFVIRVASPMTLLNQQMQQLRIWGFSAGTAGIVLIFVLVMFFNRLIDRQANASRQDLESKVQGRTHELMMMQQLGGLMTACTSIESACKVVEPIFAQLLPQCRGTITMLKASRNRLDVVYHWGQRMIEGEWYGRDECWALLKGHTHMSQESQLVIPCNHTQLKDEGFEMCIPLLAQGETLGVMHLHFVNESDMLTGRSLAESLSEQIGLALANIQLRDNLSQQAVRDPLTGLFNRRHLMEVLEHQIAQSSRFNKPLSLLMLDIDHFKRFNDTFGHDAGDYVLKQVCQELKTSARKADLVCRYGGEELCILCPETDITQAQELAERLLIRIGAQELIHSGQSLGRVTVSGGIACNEGSEISVEALIKQSDDALYRAKENGRNRVELANQPTLDAVTDAPEPANNTTRFPVITEHHDDKAIKTSA
ncbi:sensor domain-containing diguanylate cyclase [Ferrimonas pelagia]|uniref:diguanylate cyclase n=1 Tax=Ferrimonas pelagia TaxID=1177826 RepID=A0ABP9EKD8_9GAMM